MTSSLEPGRPPLQIRPDLWVFPSNRDCRGGSSWWLDVGPEPVLIDCPPLSEATFAALRDLSQGRCARILLTSREGHGRLRRLQERMPWPVLVQEQEAYLLPGVQQLETFSEETVTRSGLRLLWTPGPTPGHAVVHAPEPVNVLFCGRLLVPCDKDQLAPLQHRRTFHWPRQQRSLHRLRRWLPPEAAPELASGAGLGALRGAHLAPFHSWNQQTEAAFDTP